LKKEKEVYVGLFECGEVILFTRELIGLIYSNMMNAERGEKKIPEQSSSV